jgi:YD repeat-containing protein
LTAAGGDDQIIEYDADPDIACTASSVRVKQTTNGLGQSQVEVSNALGETVAVFDDNCGRVAYDYDATGNLIRATGADSETVTMSYDLAGRKIALSDPDKGNWQYAYNPLGEMTRQRDAKAQAIDFTYDALGRVTNRRELSGVSSLTDATFTTHNHEITTYQNSTSLAVMGKGQPTSIIYRQDESGTILQRRAYVYDSFGRVDIVSTTVGSDQFAEQTTYDQFGRVFQQFDASGGSRGVRYHYDGAGYLLSLREAREGTSGVDYQMVGAMDARGNVTELTLGNNVKVSANYDAGSGRLSQIQAVDLSTNGS